MIGDDQIAITLASHLPKFDGPRLRQTYENLVSGMIELECPPSHLAWSVLGQHRNFKTYPKVHKKLEELEWETITSVSIKSLKADRELETRGAFDWTSEANTRFNRTPFEPPAVTDTWHLNWSVVPAEAGVANDRVLEQMTALAALVVDRYGYVSLMPRRYGPGLYHGGLQLYGSGRTEEQDNNIGAWAMRTQHYHHYLLRDIYPYNFLTSGYLDARLNDITLESWINSDASRGTTLSHP